MEHATALPHPGSSDRLRSLGRAIRSARSSTTQVELATALKRPQASISAWENGHVDLSVERIWALEATLGVAHGRLLTRAGYISPEALVAHTDVELPPGDPVRLASSGRDATFPEHVRGWLAEYRPLLESIRVLRSVAVDPAALDALVRSKPVTILRCSWELWEEMVLEPGQDANIEMTSAVTAADVELCRRALWGTELRVPVALRVCKPVP